MGVQGSPGIVLQGSALLPGYLPARQLIERITAAAEGESTSTR
jgi:hypothetical protein